LLSIGVDDAFDRVAPGSLDEEEAFERALKRIPALKENACEILAKIAKIPLGTDKLFELGVVDTFLKYFKVPYKTEAEKFVYTSINRCFGNICSHPSGATKLVTEKKFYQSN